MTQLELRQSELRRELGEAYVRALPSAPARPRAPPPNVRGAACAHPRRRQRDRHLLRAAGAGGARGRRGAGTIKKKKTNDTRFLVCSPASQGRSGCGVAALWCTTHAGFAPCSPTFRVPLGTSHANSADVFTDLFGRKLRHGRSRKRRSERDPHHAEGTP